MAFWILNKINCTNKQFNWKTEITKIHAHRLIKTMKGGVLVYDKDASMHVEKYSFENQLHGYMYTFCIERPILHDIACYQLPIHMKTVSIFENAEAF